MDMDYKYGQKTRSEIDAFEYFKPAVENADEVYLQNKIWLNNVRLYQNVLSV